MRDRLIEICGAFPVWHKTLKEEWFPQAVERLADHLLANGVTVQEWISVKDRLPNKYRDECGNLIPFLVCEIETEYPFRALFDGKTWGDGVFPINVTHWMPLPQPPKGE